MVSTTAANQDGKKCSAAHFNGRERIGFLIRVAEMIIKHNMWLLTHNMNTSEEPKGEVTSPT